MAETLLFLGTHDDKPYLPRLKELVGTATVYVVLDPIQTITEVVLHCKKRNITGVISTSKTMLTKLLGREHERKQPSLDSYAGSYFKRDGIEFVFINPLDHLVSVSYGPFLARRFISKLTSPKEWAKQPQFNWELATPTNIENIFSQYQSAYAIACDIETYKENLAIRCCGYTAIFFDPTHDSGFRTHSVVLPVDSEWALAWLRKFNWELKAPKIFQNGKYDCAYLSRYNAVPFNYLWDTANLFHCWYSELPKDLATLGAFFVREAMYWKDLAETSDLQQYYLYNAKDTWTTALVWIQQMLQMPEWARTNYLQEFPLVFPCHLAEMTGIKRDMEALKRARGFKQSEIESKSKSLDTMLGVSNFNVNSPIQMKKLLIVLGCKDLESADEKNLKKAALRHPLNALIINLVIEIRKARKLISTYLTEGKELNERILYALNPHATDTARLASKEHHFWCGLQAQNIPRGRDVKQTLIADDGFRLGESDLEQAESRDTAHIAGDENLITAVSGSRDFHSVNASAFFGCTYESIYDDEAGCTKDKKLRDLAKRVNHGANYNMGAGVLVDTMGLDKIWEAGRLLKLPRLFTPIQIAEHLLAQFHKTYPNISKAYYPGVVAEILTTNMLASKAKHDVPYQATTEGWVRYCFGKPNKNKSDLNAYVAHAPQSLNACTLNKAFMRVFYEIAMHPVHSRNFKLCAQIHDSILFQFREGHEYLAAKVKEAMEIPVTIKGYDGKTRTFTVPAAVKLGKDNKGALRWSETE